MTNPDPAREDAREAMTAANELLASALDDLAAAHRLEGLPRPARSAIAHLLVELAKVHRLSESICDDLAKGRERGED